jgi:hypothetical protein
MDTQLVPQVRNHVGFAIKPRRIKNLVVQLPMEAHLQIQQMKLDLHKDSMKEVVRDALNDYFKRHGYMPLA